MKKVLLTFLILLTMGFVVHAEEEKLVSFKFTAANLKASGTSVSSYTQTWNYTENGYSLSIANFNNNGSNWGKTGEWDYIACGTNKGVTTSYIATQFKVPGTVKTIKYSTGGKLTKSKVTGIKVYYSSDLEFTNPTEISADIPSAVTTSYEITIQNAPENQYYKIEVNCEKGSSNALMSFASLDFIYTTVSESDSRTPVALSLGTEDGTDEVGLGETVALKLTATNSEDAPATIDLSKVTYSVTTSGIVSISNGTVTGLAEGTATVKADFAGDDNYLPGNTSFELTVVDNRLDAGLSYSASEVEVDGLEGTFNRPILSKNTNATITYTSSDTEVAVVNKSGLVTIVGYGRTTITATAPATDTYKGGSASYELVVKDIRLDAGLAFNPTELTVEGLRGTYTLPTLTFATNAQISYSSSNTNVATVSATGALTLKGYGTSIITASADENDNYMAGTATYTLTVNDNRPSVTLTFADASKTVNVGETYKNALTAEPAEAASAVVYTSSDNNIATVDADGTVHGVSDGKCTITASIPEGHDSFKAVSKSYSVKIHDANKLEETFDFLNEPYYGLPLSKQFKSSTIAIKDDNGELIEPVYIDLATNSGTGFGLYPTSGNPKGLRVYSGKTTMTFKVDEENFPGYVITGITFSNTGNITTTFTVGETAGDSQNSSNPSWSGEAAEVIATLQPTATTAIQTITVTYKKKASLRFLLPSYYVNFGESFVEPVPVQVTDGALTYSSSNTDVADVDAATGKVTIKAVGEATITVASAATSTYTAAEASYVLTVNDKPVRVELTLALSAEPAEVQLHKTLALDLNVTAPEGHELDESKLTVIYSSSNPEVATVDENGVVTGLSLGETTISVDVDNENEFYTSATGAKLTVTVVDKRPQPVLTFEPAEGTVNTEQELTLNLNITAEGGEELDTNAVKALVEYTVDNVNKAQIVTEGGVTKVKGLAHGTCTITASIAGNDDIRPASAIFALNVVDPNLDVYTLVENAADIVPNGEYVFIGYDTATSKYYGMAAQGNKLRNTSVVTVSDNQFVLEDPETVSTIVLEPTEDGKYLLKVSTSVLTEDGNYEVSTKYLNASTSATDLTSVDTAEGASAFSLTISSDYLAKIVNDSRSLRFNFDNSPVIVRSYVTTNTGQKDGSLYKLPGTGLYAPEITSEDNMVTITRNPNGDPNAKIYYTINGEEKLYSAPFEVTKVGTEVSAVVKSGNFSSAVTTKTITWTKTVFGSLTEVFEEANGGSEVTLNFELTALYQKGEYLYVKDAEKYVLIKGETTAEYENGNVIAAGSTVTVNKTGNIVTLTPIQLGEATAGETVEAVEPTSLRSVSAANNARYFKLRPVTVTMTDGLNGTIKGENTTVALYDQFNIGIESGKHLTVIGFVNATETGVQFFPIFTETNDADAVPGPVVFSIPTDELEYEDDAYEFPMGTELTFYAEFATSFNVKFGDKEEITIDAAEDGNFVYRALDNNGEEIKVTPMNDNVDTGEEVTYTFLIVAEEPNLTITPASTVTPEAGNEPEEGAVCVKRGTEVTISCPLADQIYYMVSNDADEVIKEIYENGSVAKFNVEDNYEVMATAIFFKDEYHSTEEDNTVGRGYAEAQYVVYYPLQEVLDFTGTEDKYGLKRMSGTISYAVEDRTLTGTEYTYVVNSGCRLWNATNRIGLNMFEAGANKFTPDSGVITVTAPKGYHIALLETGTINATSKAFNPSTTNAGKFTKVINHGKVTGTISYNYTDPTGEKKYINVPGVRVTLVKAKTPNWEQEFKPELRHDDHEGYVVRKGVKVGDVQMYDVWMKLPKDCHLYYRQSNGSIEPAAYAPRRAVDHSGYTMANTPNGELEDVHTFSVPEGTVEYYAYHPATDKASTPAYFDVNNDNLTTGIEGVEVDGSEEAVYYNLQGLRVVNPGAGVYIKIVDGKAVKVVL